MGKLYCCVPSCLSTSGTSVRLHRIPLHKRQQYADLIQRSNNWIPNGNSRICEKHFSPDQYLIKFSTIFCFRTTLNSSCSIML